MWVRGDSDAMTHGFAARLADSAFRGTYCARKSKSGIEVRNRLKYGIYLR